MKKHERILKVHASSAIDSKSIRKRFEFYSRIAGKYSVFRKFARLPILMFLKLSTGAVNKKIYRKSINNYLRNYFNIYFKVPGLLEKNLSYYRQSHGGSSPESEFFSNIDADLQGVLRKNGQTLLSRSYLLPINAKNAFSSTESKPQHSFANTALHYINPIAGYLQRVFNTDVRNARSSQSYFKNAFSFSKSIFAQHHSFAETALHYPQSAYLNTYTVKESSRLKTQFLNKEKNSSESSPIETAEVRLTEKDAVSKANAVLMQESKVLKTISPETKEYGEHGKNNLILARNTLIHEKHAAFPGQRTLQKENILISNTQRMKDGVSKNLSAEVFSHVYVKNSQVADHVGRILLDSKNSDNSSTDLVFRKTGTQKADTAENKVYQQTVETASIRNNFHGNIPGEKLIGGINTIADRVYRMIERKIAIEIERRGLSNGR